MCWMPVKNPRKRARRVAQYTEQITLRVSLAMRRWLDSRVGSVPGARTPSDVARSILEERRESEA